MVSSSAKALLLFMLLLLPCTAFSQSPYSDAAYRTFITVSVNGSTVWARATYLNITYFSQVNGSALAELYRKANATKDLGVLYQPGNYSTENFTAEVDAVNGSLLRFTFEGGNITDGSGNEICNPVKADENGTATCGIRYFKDSSGNEVSLEQYKSCGYVEVRSDQMRLGGATLPSAVQTAVACPKDNYALSAFGPAIASGVGANLPVCFPAMLVVGLLIAAMYYSGRDPLSLFDITTPKLPKTQTFKVKMATSPQMLRAVQRRYIMIKGQARRDAVKEIARMAKAAGKSDAEVKEAKRKMGGFYNELDRLLKKGKLNDANELAMRQKWADIVNAYADTRGGKRVERSFQFSSGLLDAYLKAHLARDSMNAARNKTAKSWWTKNVSDKVMGKLTDASVAFETSKTGRVLGRIPFVKKVVSTPTKVLDVAAQFRGSRNALKGVRGELIGQAASMIGQRTMLGKPIYKAARALHIGKSGNETMFGAAYRRLAGRSFKAFEDKHDMSKKKLVEYYKVADSIRQVAIDSHNAMFDDIARNLIASMGLRMNAMAQVAAAMKGMGKEKENSLLRSNSLDEIFAKIRGGLAKTDEGKRLSKDITALLGADAGRLKQSDVDKLLVRVEGASIARAEKENLSVLLRRTGEAIARENRLQEILKDLRQESTQYRMLMRLSELSEGGGAQLRDAINRFGDAEKALRANLMVFLDNDPKSRSLNYYRIMDRDQLKSDIAEGMSREKLLRKYGEMLDRVVDSPDDYRNAVRANANVLAAEARVFSKFDKENAEMKGWLLRGEGDRHIERYVGIAALLSKSSFGKNPLELCIREELTRVLQKMNVPQNVIDGILYRQDEKGQRVYAMTGMDALEQAFKEKAMGKEAYNQLRMRLGVDPESVLKAAMPNIIDFAREWSARQYAAIEMMHGGQNAGKYMASFKNALSAIENSSKVRDTLSYLGGEKPFYRAEMGYADYRGADTEALVFTARGWEKLFGFVVSDRMAGASRGEQVLHLLSAARADYASTVERYRILYLNLINEKSIFYDATFAAGKTQVRDDELKGYRLDAKAYEALLARGYTWNDKKNGLELLLSVDRKSSPMLEYDSRYFGKYLDANGKEVGNRTGIVLKEAYTPDGKADIRDYAPLVARTMGSNYSTREVGFMVLMKQDVKDKDGNLVGEKWIYCDPFKAKGAGEAYGSADKQLTMRADIMKALVGIQNGEYDLAGSGAPIRVISAKDFTTYAKDKNYQHVFGMTDRLDRFREGLRDSTLYKPSMLAAELMYGAYSDRVGRMHQWYAGQWQLRQALDSLGHAMKDERDYGRGMEKNFYDNKERFRLSNDYFNEHYKGADRKVRETVAEEMRKLAGGETVGGFDSMRAWGTEWRSRIASGIVGELGKAETDLYNSKVEVRALGRLMDTCKLAMEKHKGDKALYGEYAALYSEYKALHADALARKDEMRSDYKEAKKEYMGFNRDVLGWTGSHGSFAYQPQRTMWNLGLASKLLDSHYVQGTKDAFYQISESSVMRDPRVAIGATSPGWEYSYYVGYHTGQNVYERARFWATNSLWEQQMRFQTDLAYTVHKWWNDRISFFARYTSGYPAPVQSDMMYAPQHQDRKPLDYLKTLLVTVPFQPRAYSDYHRARLQDAISFTGLGAAAATYQSLGGSDRGAEGRSWLRNFLDKHGAESAHYTGSGGTPYRLASQQRYVDQVSAFDNFVNEKGSDFQVRVNGESMSLLEARDRLKMAASDMEYGREKEYKEAISDAIKGYVNLKDRRGRFVRDVFSGSDIQEDGSRNRFLDMYSMFHSNVFVPSVPGMYGNSPIGPGEWHAFPQVARNIENAQPGSKLYMTKHYWEAGYDAAEGRVTFADRFSTREDAVVEAYRNDVPMLMHLMRMQQKDIQYAPINTPSLFFAAPIWMGLGRKLWRTAITYRPELESLRSTTEEHKLHQFFSWAPGHDAYERHLRYKEDAALRGQDAADNTREEQKAWRKNRLDEELAARRGIYGDRASRLTEETTSTSEFLKSTMSMTHRLVNQMDSWRITTVPGTKKIGKKTIAEYEDAMLKR